MKHPSKLFTLLGLLLALLLVDACVAELCGHALRRGEIVEADPHHAGLLKRCRCRGGGKRESDQGGEQAMSKGHAGNLVRRTGKSVQRGATLKFRTLFASLPARLGTAVVFKPRRPRSTDQSMCTDRHRPTAARRQPPRPVNGPGVPPSSWDARPIARRVSPARRGFARHAWRGTAPRPRA